ncbi:MAG: hypothetical protein ACRBDL_09580 [Alphaproteobacteria bacterium]
MGAFTGPLKFFSAAVVISAVVATCSYVGGKVGLSKLNDAVDADGDGTATTQEYGGATADKVGDAAVEVVEFIGGAAEKAPEVGKRVLESVGKEWDLPDLKWPEDGVEVPKVLRDKLDDDCQNPDGTYTDGACIGRSFE